MSVHKKALLTVARMWQNSVDARFVDSLAQMLLYSQQALCGPDEYIHYMSASVSYHPTARKEIADNFLGEHLLMLDTDHIFAPDLLTRLWEFKKAYNSPVISGLYLHKTPPCLPVARVINPQNQISQLLGWDEGDLVLGDLNAQLLVGGGCLLIDRWVLNKIKQDLHQEPFDLLNTPVQLSEDFSFCYRCREIGVPVHLATTVESHHLIPGAALYAEDVKGLIKPKDTYNSPR